MFYSQKDESFAHVLLGNSKKVTIGGYGCTLTSIANLFQMTVLELMSLLIKGGAFGANNGMLTFQTVAEILGASYKYTTKKPLEICVVETRDTSTDQHFFLYNPENNMMIDPLDKKPDGESLEWKECDYNIVSYRVFEGAWENESEISEWAKESVEWAKEKGLINNWENPKKPVTREELAVILNRLNIV